MPETDVSPYLLRPPISYEEAIRSRGQCGSREDRDRTVPDDTDPLARRVTNDDHLGD